MIKHRNISALIAAAAFGSTALFGCSSKDDPESLTDDELKLMETYTEKFTKATEQAKKDKNAKACQAVLDEFTKAEKKWTEKMDKAIEKLSKEEQEKKEEELESKLGSKMKEKMSALDAARSKCFETGGAADPVTAEQAAAEGKEMANGICDDIVELCGEGAQALSEVVGRTPDICDSHVKPIVSGFEESMKEIQEDLQELENQDLSVADASRFKAAKQALAQWEKSLTKFGECFVKPVGQMVVISSSKSPNGGGRLTIASYQLKPVQEQRRGRGSRHGGSLSPEPPASPPRPRQTQAPEFAKLPQAQQTAMVNEFAQQISQSTSQIKGVSLDGKPKEQQEAMLKKAIKDTEPIFTNGFGFIKTEADFAAYQKLPGTVQDKLQAAQQEMRDAIAALVKKVVPFTTEEKTAIQQFWQALMEKSVQKSEAMMTKFVAEYNAVQPKSGVTCDSIDAKVQKASEDLQKKSVQDYQELLDASAQGQEPSKWLYFVRLSDVEQAAILKMDVSELSDLQNELFSMNDENMEEIQAASEQCKKRAAGTQPPAEDSESGDESVDGAEAELEFTDYFNMEEANGKPAPAKVAAVKAYLTKVSEADAKLDSALTAIKGTTAEAAKAFVDAVTEHSTTLEQLTVKNGEFANALSVVFDAGLVPPSEDEEEQEVSVEDFLKDFLGRDTELNAYKAKRSAVQTKLFPTAKIALALDVAEMESSQLLLEAFKGLRIEAIRDLNKMLGQEGRTKRRDLARGGAGDLIPGGKPVAGKQQTKKLAPKRNLSDPMH